MAVREDDPRYIARVCGVWYVNDCGEDIVGVRYHRLDGIVLCLSSKHIACLQGFLWLGIIKNRHEVGGQGK